jgi:CheY-like chemotaxis protein
MTTRNETHRPVILLVDDCVDSCALYAEALQADFHVFVATSGAEAIERARLVQPAFIVTDWSLPDMTCEATLSRIRENPRMRRVPTIVVSGYPEPHDRPKFWDAYFVKPCDPRTLSATITRMLGRAAPSVPMAVG